MNEEKPLDITSLNRYRFIVLINNLFDIPLNVDYKKYATIGTAFSQNFPCSARKSNIASICATAAAQANTLPSISTRSKCSTSSRRNGNTFASIWSPSMFFFYLEIHAPAVLRRQENGLQRQPPGSLIERHAEIRLHEILL
jgi:hypothetical protein